MVTISRHPYRAGKKGDVDESNVPSQQSNALAFSILLKVPSYSYTRYLASSFTVTERRSERCKVRYLDADSQWVHDPIDLKRSDDMKAFRVAGID